MKTEDFIEYLKGESWSKKWIENEGRDKDYEDFEYERSYADFIYDDLTVWKNEERVSVLYNEICWGYTNYNNYDFTYEEFINWWEGMK